MSVLSLKMAAGERIFVNGAVIGVDRRASLQLHNAATFLRESNVMQADEATTPLKRLYFAMQRGLLSPADARVAALEAGVMTEALLTAVSSPAMVDGLLDARDALARGRHYGAMRAIKPLFAVEAELLGAAA